MTAKPRSLVENDSGRQRVRIPRTRAGSRRNGVPVAQVAAPVEAAAGERRINGQFEHGSRTLQAAGGKAARRRDVLAKRLNLPDLTSDDRKRAGVLQKALLRDYTRLSGGELLTDVALLTEQATLRCVASRVAFAAGDAGLGSKLANDCRSDLLACRTLCANDSDQRKAGGKLPPVLDAAAEADLDRQVAELMAKHSKSTPRGDEPAQHMVTGNNEVTEKQLETEED